MTHLIDIHAHLQFPQFDGDRARVIERARGLGIKMINVGTDIETSRGAVKLSEKHPDAMRATVGLHPTDLPPADKLARIFAELEKLACLESVVGIGECGLDYFRAAPDSAPDQKKIFVRQIHLANKLKKPLMLHIRGAGAYRAAGEILRSETRVLGNVHFFTGDWEEAQLFLDLGFALSFTGVVTFANDYDEVIKNTPLDRIMIETDCPFAAPIPHRGQRNEPSYLPFILKRLTEVRRLSVEEMARITVANTRRLFAFS